jgi:hypothetical protein
MCMRHLPTAAHFSLMTVRSSSLCEKIMTESLISTIVYPLRSPKRAGLRKYSLIAFDRVLVSGPRKNGTPSLNSGGLAK